MEKIHLSIIPSHFCNFNCEYCYLGDLRKDKQLLSLDILKEKLQELTVKYDISVISIYGGEVSLLQEDYLNDLYDIIKDYKISITTNLSNDWIINWCNKHNIKLSVSLNEERTDYNKILNKLIKLKGNNISISSVVLPSLLSKTTDEVMGFYENLGFDVYFIQYHPSIYSRKYSLNQKEYNEFLEKVLSKEYSINVENRDVLNDEKYNPTMRGFIFLNPYGKWSTVFYKNDIEYYKEYNDLNSWEDDCNKEYDEYFKNCMCCEYFMKCKAEHLVNYKKPYCSGLYNIIKNK